MQHPIQFLLLLLFSLIPFSNYAQDWVIGGGVGYASFNSQITNKVLRNTGGNVYIEFNKKLSWGFSYNMVRSQEVKFNSIGLNIGKVWRRGKVIQFPTFSYLSYYNYKEKENIVGLPIEFGKFGAGALVGIRLHFESWNIEAMGNFGSFAISNIGSSRSEQGVILNMEYFSIGLGVDIDVSINYQ